MWYSDLLLCWSGIKDRDLWWWIPVVKETMYFVEWTRNDLLDQLLFVFQTISLYEDLLFRQDQSRSAVTLYLTAIATPWNTMSRFWVSWSFVPSQLLSFLRAISLVISRVPELGEGSTSVAWDWSKWAVIPKSSYVTIHCTFSRVIHRLMLHSNHS